MSTSTSIHTCGGILHHQGKLRQRRGRRFFVIQSTPILLRLCEALSTQGLQGKDIHSSQLDYSRKSMLS